MPVTTPVLWNASETGVRLGDVLTVVGTAPAGGTGVFRGRRIQASRTDSFPAVAPNLVHDFPTAAPNGREVTSQEVEVYLELLDLVPGDQIWFSAEDVDSDGTESAWATAFSITMEEAEVSADQWRASQ